MKKITTTGCNFSGCKTIYNVPLGSDLEVVSEGDRYHNIGTYLRERPPEQPMPAKASWFRKLVNSGIVPVATGIVANLFTKALG